MNTNFTKVFLRQRKLLAKEIVKSKLRKRLRDKAEQERKQAAATDKKDQDETPV